jgi:hypothetical protein
VHFVLPFLALATLFAGLPLAESAEPQQADPTVQLRLVEAGSNELALVFDIEDGWHIYWHNPGDSGMATSARLQPEDTPPRFPGPQRFVSEESGFVTYGYTGRTALFFDAAKQQTSAPPTAEARWLICRERCILQEGSAVLSSAVLSDLDALRRRLPNRVTPLISYREETAVVELSGGPFELFPPLALEERLVQFRSNSTGLQLDLKPGPSVPLPVVLKTTEGSFLTFNLPPPIPPKE